MNKVYIHTIIIVVLMTMMDVFNFRLDWGLNESGFDLWHLTKWILIAYLIADKMQWKIPTTYKDAGIVFMWLVVITVGLHNVILHVIF